MTRATGQLERSLAALTIGVQQDRQQRKAAVDDGFTGEHEQQLLVPLAGEATTDWRTAEREVHWEMPFLCAPQQRRVPFEQPHFTYGVEFTSPLMGIVVIQAHVLNWIITEESWYVGANMGFIVGIPGTSGSPTLRVRDNSNSVRYSAVVHLRFQGYATYAEGDDFQS